MTGRDRLQALLDPANTTLNGIDFVEIAAPGQTVLRVHFLNAVALAGTVDAVRIVGGASIPTVPVHPIHDATDWSADAEGRPVLKLTVPAPGDFSTYELLMRSAALDSRFAGVRFSFKAGCPSLLDCAAGERACPPLEGDLPPIDYLAKDFLSFRRALSDFSVQRYPEWAERSEGDFGVMVMEALSALADDLSYTQDRIAGEASLDTATQRRSIVRHARLVDYEPRPATSARVLLQCNVRGGPVASGLLVSAAGAAGAQVDFETGTGLADRTNYTVDARWNAPIAPYWWDDGDRCLRAGSTEAWVAGHGFGFVEGQALLIDTAGATSADPHVRQVVHLTPSRPGRLDWAVEEADPLFADGGGPARVTHISWRPDDALQADHDLTRTQWAGNIVPATQGRRYGDAFAIGAPPPGAAGMAAAAVRAGPNSSPDALVPQYLATLSRGPVAWLDDPDGAGELPLPEVALVEAPVAPETIATPWTWRRLLLDSEPFEQAFTLDPMRLAPTADRATGARLLDYDGDDGDTIRFGDGQFGEIPDDGATFQVTYRVGLGAAGNVAAGAITQVSASAAAVIDTVTNPFPAAGGADREPDQRVRRRAPQAFRATQYRAVRARDYELAAQRLEWVQRAGTAFRWTGSWSTVFTTADPRGREIVTVREHTQLIDQLNRYRLAGYESYVPVPRFVSLDLVVRVCAQPDAFRGDVQGSILEALGTGIRPDGHRAFFHPDRLTFGTPLERSALEAAIQDAYGVAGVAAIAYRRRGVVPDFEPMPDTVAVGPDQILRVDNDPSRAEAGSLRVVVGGGK